MHRRTGERALRLEVTARARKVRELKRTLQRHLIQPSASLLTAGEIHPGTRVRADLNSRKQHLVLRSMDQEALVLSASRVLKSALRFYRRLRSHGHRGAFHWLFSTLLEATRYHRSLARVAFA